MVPLLKFVLFATLLVQTLNSVNADAKCDDMVQELMNGNMGSIVPCINEIGYTTAKERGAGYNCIMKCVLSKAGSLTPDGKISVMIGITFIMEHFPNEYIEKALTEISKCQDFANIDVSDPNDKNCIKMRPLIQCGVDFIFNICK